MTKAKNSTQDFTPKRADGVFARKHPGGIIALLPPTASDFYFSLDKMAAEYWLFMNGRNTFNAIVAIIAERNKLASTERLAADCRKLHAQLKRSGLAE